MLLKTFTISCLLGSFNWPIYFRLIKVNWGLESNSDMYPWKLQNSAWHPFYVWTLFNEKRDYSEMRDLKSGSAKFLVCLDERTVHYSIFKLEPAPNCPPDCHRKLTKLRILWTFRIIVLRKSKDANLCHFPLRAS